MVIVHAIVKSASAGDGSATATVQRTLLERKRFMRRNRPAAAPLVVML